MNISKKQINEIEELKKLKDENIDYSDIPELDDSFWNNAELIEPEKKVKISIRVDEEVLDWFKAHGKGYQSFMNTVLKTFVKAKKNKKAV